MSGGMIVIKHNAGAPLGGRVHWFLYHLDPIVKRAYDVLFDYDYHHYFLSRKQLRSMIDCFIVVRTSKRCFRVMYYHFKFNYFEYQSFQKSNEAADYVLRIFEKMKSVESGDI